MNEPHGVDLPLMKAWVEVLIMRDRFEQASRAQSRAKEFQDCAFKDWTAARSAFQMMEQSISSAAVLGRGRE